MSLSKMLESWDLRVRWASQKPSSHIFYLTKNSFYNTPVHLAQPPFFWPLIFHGAYCFAGIWFLVWLHKVSSGPSFGFFSFPFIQTSDSNCCLSCLVLNILRLSSQVFLYLTPSYFPLDIWISVASLNDKVRIFQMFQQQRGQ